MCFDCPPQLLSEKFLVLRRTERDILVNVCWVFMLFCQIATNLEFSRQIFQEYRDIKFHESPCSGSRFCSWWTEGRTDVKRLTVAFSNFANRPKKLLSIISIYLYAKFLQQFYFNINICRNLTILVQYICASPVRHFNYVPPLTYYCMGSYS